MRQPIPFNGPSLTGRSSKVQAQRTVNMYAQQEQPGAKGDITLYSDPGVKPLDVGGVGPVRSNGYRFNNQVFFASGNELIHIDNSFVFFTEANKFATTSGSRVIMAAGTDKIIMVDGTTGKQYTTGGGVITIADADFPDDATHVAILDGYYIANNPANIGRFYVSLDGVSWAAADFATAQAKPDGIVAVAANNRDLLLFGTECTEIWNNVGAPSVPFRRHPNGVLQWGCIAPYSVVAGTPGTFWLASTSEGETKVMMLNGFSPQSVSDDWLDWVIGTFSVVADAFGYIHLQRGHWYYQLTFPTADRTFVYQIDTGTWFERKSWGIGRHRSAGHGFINRQHVIGDYATGDFYTLDFDYYFDGTSPHERLRRSMVVHKDTLRMTFNEVIVEFQGGVGTALGDGSDPQAQLRYSDDGGNTWSQWLTEPIGRMGEYETLAVWRQLGDSRERIFEVRVTDPVEVVIIKAYADVELSDD